MSVAVLIPVLDRPDRVEPLLESLVPTLRGQEDGGARDHALFLCSWGDAAQVAACRKPAVTMHGVGMKVVPWPATRGDYARKMNFGLRWAAENGHEWAFLAADDLSFRPGWLEAALACHADTHACVIGTNDLGNDRVTAGLHSTHTLVRTAYLECGTIDEDGIVLHEGYWHNFVDVELVQTAMWRETWAFADGSHVEHLHPNWQKAAADATYELGQAHFEQDRALLNQRRALWGGGQ